MGITRPAIERDAKHVYTVGDRKYPSVTTILDATVPKNLSWWGMRVGCEGAAWLLNRNLLSNSYTGEEIEQLLKDHKLTVNHQRDKAGDRGTLIHEALETYGKTGELEIPDALDEADHDRIAALAAWLLENKPVFLAQEVLTVSIEHEYAGTFDARVRFEAGEHQGQTALIDLKTSKRVYPESHFPQLEAYEHAEVELGEAPTDFRAVLHLPPEGEARLIKSVDTFEDFKCLLSTYRAQQARKQRLKEGK